MKCLRIARDAPALGRCPAVDRSHDQSKDHQHSGQWKLEAAHVGSDPQAGSSLLGPAACPLALGIAPLNFLEMITMDVPSI